MPVRLIIHDRTITRRHISAKRVAGWGRAFPTFSITDKNRSFQLFLFWIEADIIEIQLKIMVQAAII
jgi:hypothetical protein